MEGNLTTSSSYPLNDPILMNDICILTDSTTQFSNSLINGIELIHVIHTIDTINGQKISNGRNINLENLDGPQKYHFAFESSSPSIDSFLGVFENLRQNHNQIIGIFPSNRINKSYENAIKAANLSRHRAYVHIINSNSISIGTGYLVEQACQMVLDGLSSYEIINSLRISRMNIYSMVLVNSLRYLERIDYIDHHQYIAGEILGFSPIYNLENGRLISPIKVRNSRHLSDIIIGFLSEFEHIERIGLIRELIPNGYDSGLLRQKLHRFYPHVTLNDLNLNYSLAGVFGPTSFSMFAITE